MFIFWDCQQPCCTLWSTVWTQSSYILPFKFMYRSHREGYLIWGILYLKLKNCSTQTGLVDKRSVMVNFPLGFPLCSCLPWAASRRNMNTLKQKCLITMILTHITKGNNQNSFSFTLHFVMARMGTYIVMNVTRFHGRNHRSIFYQMYNVILKMLSSISGH
jgi:hypothetical protein